MFTAVSTYARSGVFALGVLLGVPGGAISAPLGSLDKTQPPQLGPALPLHLVAQGEFRGGNNPVWLRRGGRTGGSWNGNGRWNRGGNWRHSGRWNGKHGHGGHGHGGYWNDWDNVGIGIGLGFGLPFWGGYYPGYYSGYYDPYYAPGYYAPRRYYGAPAGGDAHVRWCYARYRSYRAWDNTFQPYVGPRRQCYSPYS
ncbi:BA14K family protein [Pseudaminobacter sp. 19-2017]|uniref:Lectin-like protein BA14k n=1 Tax=Pseudaminobacter soli (ex Zhang et al. 2022) TaxID=2831468 RepID=A0A942DVV6_9HYPH|nr:BA14K family protein [Pseudaminobacter soli]MBS3647788.1 BA14K family protein [Pseudaminobacter soli]